MGMNDGAKSFEYGPFRNAVNVRSNDFFKKNLRNEKRKEGNVERDSECPESFFFNDDYFQVDLNSRCHFSKGVFPNCDSPKYFMSNSISLGARNPGIACGSPSTGMNTVVG